MNEPTRILPAEFVAMALPTDAADGPYLDIAGVKVRWASGPVGVYVRRSSRDLSVIEIAIARHDGLAQEALEVENEEAGRYPLGPMEYWRTRMVGKYRYGPDQHLMTDEEFERDWAESLGDGGET